MIDISRRQLIRYAAAASAGLTTSTLSAFNSHAVSAASPTDADGFRIHPHKGSAMTGTPPRADDVVTIDNSSSSREKYRWALRNTRELMPTQCISRGNDVAHPTALISEPYGNGCQIWCNILLKKHSWTVPWVRDGLRKKRRQVPCIVTGGIQTTTSTLYSPPSIPTVTPIRSPPLPGQSSARSSVSTASL